MILEGIVTTLDAQGALNVAPMGPIVDEAMSRLRLRPFRTSRTYRNLKETGCGVLHVVDDVLLLARAAIGALEQPPEHFPAEKIAGRVLSAACRWYEFEVVSLDDAQERTEIEARVVHSGRIRDFFGFHRARHAVLEAAILATRVHLLPPGEIAAEFSRLRVPVEKTAGPREREAFALLENYLERHGGSASPHDDPRPAEKHEVSVKTGGRLHCGLFTDGHASGRQFGGVGIMVSPPGFHLRGSVAHSSMIVGFPEWHARLGRVEARNRELVPEIARLPPIAWKLESALPSHAGLGSGTQLALAVSAALAHLAGEGAVRPGELARRSGRGTRSAIGIHGFEHGGFLIEGGKLAGQEVSPLVARVAVPEDWRFVLIRPRDAAGLSGPEELHGFATLPPMPATTTDRLCRLALLDLVPALHEQDAERFGEALFEFGQLVGAHFAPVQGGTYADARMRLLVPQLRARGVRGIAQSSWGPTVFAVSPTAESAQALIQQLSADLLCTECDLTVASPLNHRATLGE